MPARLPIQLMLGCAAIVAAFALPQSRQNLETREIQRSAKQLVVSPDRQWAAILRAGSEEAGTLHPAPTDSLYIEPHGKGRIVQPVFVAKWHPGLSFQMQWLAPNQLEVVFPAGTEFWQRKDASGEVRVTYVAAQAPRN